MSIPLDRLYHYIESVAKDIHSNTLIYRFYPHGSKNLNDLTLLTDQNLRWLPITTYIPLYCNDQEPLSFDLYTTMTDETVKFIKNKFEEYGYTFPAFNLKKYTTNIYDKAILLHSEKRSPEVSKYHLSQFIPAYYWSHAIIAQDWFRYAQHQTFRKHNQTKSFLIYNRAWSGTREYRLKFIDLLINNNLLEFCKTNFNPNDSNFHYKNHIFTNPSWIPVNTLENYLKPTTALSCASADFDADDYNSTDIEIVLETLYDDSRLHLTEKTLRPIACSQPFLLLATYNSLQYLRDYGFKTFDGIFDESYDTIDDPVKRMQAVISEMSRIVKWSDTERKKYFPMLNKICKYNQKHFFSNDFFNSIVNELRENLTGAIKEIESTNTSETFFEIRKTIAKIPELRDFYNLTNDTTFRTRQDVAFFIKKAREYYNRHHNK